MSITDTLKAAVRPSGVRGASKLQDKPEVKGYDGEKFKEALRKVEEKLDFDREFEDLVLDIDEAGEVEAAADAVIDAVNQDEEDALQMQFLKHLIDQEEATDEDQPADENSAELDEEDATSVATVDDPELPEENFEPVVAANRSARLIELQRKQSICDDVQAAVVQGTELMRGLTERANQLSAFLEKSEFELEHLETVEKESTKLKADSASISRMYHEEKAKCEAQKKQIALLEEHKAGARETIERARIEVGRLMETKNANLTEIKCQKAMVTKLEADKQDLREQIVSLEERLDDVSGKQEASLLIIEDLKTLVQARERELAKQSSKFSDMEREIEGGRVDLVDVRSKLEVSNANGVSIKAELDEALFELESTKREMEDKLRRKDTRNAELEAKNEVVTQHLALKEDIIEKLNRKLKAAETAKLKSRKERGQNDLESDRPALKVVEKKSASA